MQLQSLLIQALFFEAVCLYELVLWQHEWWWGPCESATENFTDGDGWKTAAVDTFCPKYQWGCLR
jgi:hypothetical protein